MNFISAIFALVFSDYCFEEFFIKYNFFHVECLKAALSKVLGLGIVAGSALVKVPQIIKLFNAKSGEGISIIGNSLEILAMLANVSYNYANKYPFSSYGDGVFVLIQTTTVVTLALFYEGEQQRSIIYPNVIVVALLILTTVVPMEMLWTFQALNIPIVFFGKLAQAVTNYKNKHTGHLSFITCTLLFLGTLARIFTSIQETGDNIIILTYCIATFANGIIFSQVLYYWNAKVVSKDSKKKK